MNTTTRSVIFLCLVFASFTAFGQDSLDGVMGLRFGQPKDSVTRIIKKKSGCVAKASSDPDIFVYENCIFGAGTADIVKLLFYKNKLFGCELYFIPEYEQKILDSYRQIKTDISNKYFEPTVDVESYKSPFEKGDGHEVTAIKGGYSTIGAIWNFPGSSQRSEPGRIVLSVGEKLWVKLSYRDGPIYKEFLSELHEKQESDY